MLSPRQLAIKRPLYRESLAAFAKAAIKVLEPTTRIDWGWYLDAICLHLEACERGLRGVDGGLTRLVINVQFRALKSTVVGVIFPAWLWLRNPSLRILSASRTDRLSVRDSTAMRRLINSELYQQLIGGAWALEEDENQKHNFRTTDGGKRTATFRGGGTGEGGEVLIADDILSIDDRFSPVEIAHANAWLEGEFFTRQNDPARSVVILNMHRLSVDDPSAGAIARGWPLLSLPTEFDPTNRVPPTPLGWTDPRTEAGETLLPDRWTPAVVSELKATLGEFFEAICNQRPMGRGGAVLGSMDDVHRWTPGLAPPDRAMPQLSIDPSLKDLDPTKPRAKRSRVGIVGGAHLGARLWILSARADFMGPVALEDELKRLRLGDGITPPVQPVGPIWIEDEAAGPAIMSALRPMIPGLIPVDPGNGYGGGSKFERFVAIAHLVRSGAVLFPPRGLRPDVDALIAMILSYPNVPYDDSIDAFTQLVRMTMLEPHQGKNSIDRMRAMG